MAKSDDERGALALERTGQDRLVFEDNDVVDLLRIAIEREGGQSGLLGTTALIAVN